METQGYLCDIHRKKMETRICDIRTKIKGEDTQGICVTFTQRRVGHSEKRQKGVAVHTK